MFPDGAPTQSLVRSRTYLPFIAQSLMLTRGQFAGQLTKLLLSKYFRNNTQGIYLIQSSACLSVELYRISLENIFWSIWVYLKRFDRQIMFGDSRALPEPHIMWTSSSRKSYINRSSDKSCDMFYGFLYIYGNLNYWWLTLDGQSTPGLFCISFLQMHKWSQERHVGWPNEPTPTCVDPNASFVKADKSYFWNSMKQYFILFVNFLGQVRFIYIRAVCLTHHQLAEPFLCWSEGAICNLIIGNIMIVFHILFPRFCSTSCDES